MTRAFSSLSPQEALSIAIFIEERNAAVYHRFAEMFTEFRDAASLEIGAVFWDMAIEEKRHSAILRVKYQERYGDVSCPLTEEDLRDMIEVPNLEDGDFFAPGEASQVSPREKALQVALAAEKNAHSFYARLLEQTTDGALRRLYTELSMMEDGHVNYLQDMLDGCPMGGDEGVQ
jgi:rubrerythrin